MKYRVHLYALMRTAIEVEADSQQSAIDVAQRQFTTNGADSYRMEDAEDLQYYLVDEDGDEDYSRSQCYNRNREPVTAANAWSEPE